MAKQVFVLLSISCIAAFEAKAAVLDPALYLSPSAPFTGQPEAITQWARALDPGDLSKETREDSLEQDASMGDEEPPRARTFWPLRSKNYGIKSIHIPLTFSLTGTYGSNAGVSSGVIGSSYASVSDDSTLVTFSKSGLAGSSYGLYRAGRPGTRIYGGSGGATWSGWGNGKWGHYGKG